MSLWPDGREGVEVWVDPRMYALKCVLANAFSSWMKVVIAFFYLRGRSWY